MSEPRFYQHRINAIEGLERLPDEFGIELDLRVHDGAIVCAHDAFEPGPTMEAYFPHLRDRPLILNVKCEGIVEAVLDCCRRNGLEDFFFLGLGLSDTVKLVRAGERRVANYHSQYHHPEAPLPWEGRIDWLWIDAYDRYPVHPDVWPRLSESFKLCIGSPELYGHLDEAREERIAAVRNLSFHAVCGKRTTPWLA